MTIDDFLVESPSNNLKQCAVCKQFKSLEKFPLLGGTTKTGKKKRRCKCRTCWYPTSAAKKWNTTKGKKFKVRKSKRNRAFLIEYLTTHPCVDCGNSDIRVLEFDHVGIKTDAISELLDKSLDRIKNEIKQCEVRCANCHRIKTMERGKHYRQTAYEMIQRGESYGTIEGSDTGETHESRTNKV